MLEAQYQDAVRVEIDNLYTAFVNVLGERETVRYAEASVAGLRGVLSTTRAQLENKLITEADVGMYSAKPVRPTPDPVPSKS